MKRIGKNDFWLIGILLAFALLIWFGMGLLGNKEGVYAVVTVDGSFYGKYSLDTPQEIPITIGETVTNTLEIKDGEADMIYADCPDQLCVHQSSISGARESIICLPNKVVVTVDGAGEADIDSLAK